MFNHYNPHTVHPAFLPRPVERVTPSYRVYFKQDGKLGCIKADTDEGHEEAILSVKESLVASGEGFTNPVLAIIEGGKNGN